jgi:tetratricopeptide (TPR) repeat protein
MTDKFATISIRIYPRDEDTGLYPVEATLDDGREYSGGQMRVPQELWLVDPPDDPQAYGLLLFNTLFADVIRQAYDTVAARADVEAGGRLRVRLRIDDEAAELGALPWERLYHSSRGQLIPLSTSTLTPFSRTTSLQYAVPRGISQLPLRLLYAVANPSDLDPRLQPVDVEGEVETLRQALSDLRAKNRLQVTLMPGRTGLSPGLRAQLEKEGYEVLDGATTLEALVRVLPDCHIFHFVGHGSFSRKRGGGGTASLHLEAEDGTWQPAIDEELVDSLAATDPLPRLAFLAACQSATRDAGTEHPFVGLAPKLVRAGVPAVVAMQDRVLMQSARKLTADFYRDLLLDGLLDKALNQARHLLKTSGQGDWAIPVLYSRLLDNELVSLQKDDSLQSTNQLVAAVGTLRLVSQSEEQERDLAAELERLLEGWQKSYQGLVDLESALRRTGEDPETFAAAFLEFYNEFKDYYHSETWADEDSLVQAAARLRDEVLPTLKPQMGAETYSQVEEALSQHVRTRQRLVLGLGEFLDSMDEAVMGIRRCLVDGDVEAAIRRKQDFELEIAPTLRNSRKLLRQLDSQVMTVDGLMNRMGSLDSEAQVVSSDRLMDTLLLQDDSEQTLDHLSQRLMAAHGIDEQVLQQPGAATAAPPVRDQIDQVLAAQRGMMARGLLPAPETLHRLGMLAAYRWDYDKAVAYFREATEVDPAYVAAYQAIAWLQQSRAMHDLQAADYDTALAKLAEAREASAHIPTGQALVFQGYIAKTQAQIAARKGDGDAFQAHLGEGAQLFQRALELDPDSAGAHNGAGNIQQLLGNVDAAIAQYERAIQLAPNYTAAHHDLGGACKQKMDESQKKGDRMGAQEWCQKALAAFERTYELAQHDPGFSKPDRERILDYIAWFRSQCG